MKLKFTGSFTEWLGKIILWTIIATITMGFGLVWVVYDMIKWQINNTIIEEK